MNNVPNIWCGIFVVRCRALDFGPTSLSALFVDRRAPLVVVSTRSKFGTVLSHAVVSQTDCGRVCVSPRTLRDSLVH